MKKKKVFLITALTLVSMFANCLIGVAAESEVIVAPENVLNVQVVDKAGNPVDGINASLINSSDVEMATWTTGERTVSEINGSGISGLYSSVNFTVPRSKFEQIALPYKLASVRHEVDGGYTEVGNSLVFTENGENELTLYSVDEDISTAMTVPANTFRIVAAEGLDSRVNAGYIEPDSVNPTSQLFA